MKRKILALICFILAGILSLSGCVWEDGLKNLFHPGEEDASSVEYYGLKLAVSDKFTRVSGEGEENLRFEADDYPQHNDSISFSHAGKDDINRYTKELYGAEFPAKFGESFSGINEFQKSVLNGMATIMMRYSYAVDGQTINETQWIFFLGNSTVCVAFTGNDEEYARMFDESISAAKEVPYEEETAADTGNIIREGEYYYHGLGLILPEGYHELEEGVFVPADYPEHIDSISFSYGPKDDPTNFSEMKWRDEIEAAEKGHVFLFEETENSGVPVHKLMYETIIDPDTDFTVVSNSQLMFFLNGETVVVTFRTVVGSNNPALADYGAAQILTDCEMSIRIIQ